MAKGEERKEKKDGECPDYIGGRGGKNIKIVPILLPIATNWINWHKTLEVLGQPLPSALAIIAGSEGRWKSHRRNVYRVTACLPTSHLSQQPRLAMEIASTTLPPSTDASLFSIILHCPICTRVVRFCSQFCQREQMGCVCVSDWSRSQQIQVSPGSWMTLGHLVSPSLTVTEL